MPTKRKRAAATGPAKPDAMAHATFVPNTHSVMSIDNLVTLGNERENRGILRGFLFGIAFAAVVMLALHADSHSWE